MSLIFDLDGPLIGSKPGVYDLYKRLVPGTRLDFSIYWSEKRKGYSNFNLLEMDEMVRPGEKERFMSQWLKLIETPAFLELDQVVEGIEKNLERLSSEFQLIVFTNRQDARAVDRQLSELGLKPFFSKILVTEQKVRKTEILQSEVNLKPRDWVIGDTGQDMVLGYLLGLETCAVLTGFHGRETLERYRPSRILKSASQFHPFNLPLSNRK